MKMYLVFIEARNDGMYEDFHHYEDYGGIYETREEAFEGIKKIFVKRTRETLAIGYREEKDYAVWTEEEYFYTWEFVAHVKELELNKSYYREKEL